MTDARDATPSLTHPPGGSSLTACTILSLRPPWQPPTRRAAMNRPATRRARARTPPPHRHSASISCNAARARPRSTPPRQDTLRAGPSALLRRYRHRKTRLPVRGGVANPRNSMGYCCVLRLATNRNPSFSLVPLSTKQNTSRTLLWRPSRRPRQGPLRLPLPCRCASQPPSRLRTWRRTHRCCGLRP